MHRRSLLGTGVGIGTESGIGMGMGIGLAAVPVGAAKPADPFESDPFQWFQWPELKD